MYRLNKIKIRIKRLELPPLKRWVTFFWPKPQKKVTKEKGFSLTKLPCEYDVRAGIFR